MAEQLSNDAILADELGLELTPAERGTPARIRALQILEDHEDEHNAGISCFIFSWHMWPHKRVHPWAAGGYLSKLTKLGLVWKSAERPRTRFSPGRGTRYTISTKGRINLEAMKWRAR